MQALMYATGKYIPFANQYTKHGIKCTVNNIGVLFTVADDELVTLGLKRGDRLIAYLGPNGLVTNYNDAQLINGKVSPKLTDIPKDVELVNVESFYMTETGFYRHRTVH